LNSQGAIRGILGYAGKLGRFPALFYGAVGWAYGDFDFRGGPGAGGPIDTRAAQSGPDQAADHYQVGTVTNSMA